MSDAPHEEAQHWARGSTWVSSYQQALEEAERERQQRRQLPDVVTPEEMPWEYSRQGKLKHLIHEKINPKLKTLDLYIQELPPGGRSGKHRHMAEEYLFILEGRGYDLHWDAEVEIEERYMWQTAAEPAKYEWEAGDAVFIPVNTVHQHCNADPARPARFLSATHRAYRFVGYHDLEQLEDAPDYAP